MEGQSEHSCGGTLRANLRCIKTEILRSSNDEALSMFLVEVPALRMTLWPGGVVGVDGDVFGGEVAGEEAAWRRRLRRGRW